MQDKDISSSKIQAPGQSLPTPMQLSGSTLAFPFNERFVLGSIIVTPEALRTMQRFGIEPTALLLRHASGDWGDLDPLDQRANERALLAEDRLVSCYVLRSLIGAHPRREALWVVTEGDRKFTTLLLQDESWREGT